MQRMTEVLGKYIPVDLSIRVIMGQNPKHAEYMQVLKTLLKSSGVQVSQSAVRLIFCY